MAYETININARKCARIEAERIKAIRKTNWLDYAKAHDQAYAEHRAVSEFTTDYIKTAYKVRHDDPVIFDNILQTIHLNKFLKHLVKFLN